jgi:3-deoxy-7-phosphoheptulonate synthase
MASGLSMPVGFKNGTNGDVGIAINAMGAAESEHNFIGINEKGQVAILQTKGNPDAHLILRGGKKPNYQAEHVDAAAKEIESAGYNPAIIVDCSHANSNKDYANQPLVAQDILAQIESGNTSIVGIMLESHLNEGNQKLTDNLNALQYGVSITDACINWQTTESLVVEMASKLKQVDRFNSSEQLETA